MLSSPDKPGPVIEQDQCREWSGQVRRGAYIIVLHKLQGLRQYLSSSDVTPQGLGKACQLFTHANSDHIVDVLAHGETSPQKMLLYLYMQHDLAVFSDPTAEKRRGGVRG